MTVVDASNSRRLVEYISQLTNQVDAFWNLDAILEANADQVEADMQHTGLGLPEQEDWTSGAAISTEYSPRNVSDNHFIETSLEATPVHLHKDTTGLGLGFCSSPEVSRTTGSHMSQQQGSLASFSNPDEDDDDDCRNGFVAWQDLEPTAPLTPMSPLSSSQPAIGLESAWPEEPNLGHRLSSR